MRYQVNVEQLDRLQEIYFPMQNNRVGLIEYYGHSDEDRCTDE